MPEPRHPTTWFRLRVLVHCALLCISFGVSMSGHAELREASSRVPVDFYVLLGISSMFFFSTFAALFVLMMGGQAAVTSKSERWSLPNHWANPFRIRQPAIMWHFCGWIIVSFGVGPVLASPWAGAPALMSGVMVIGAGGAILLGVHVSARIYRRKFVTE